MVKSAALAVPQCPSSATMPPQGTPVAALDSSALPGERAGPLADFTLTLSLLAPTPTPQVPNPNPNPNRLDHPGQLNRITFTNIDEVLPANESRQVRASFAGVAAVRRLNRYTLTAAGK